VKKQWPYFLLAFAVPILLVLWWWGMFTVATIEVKTLGPYRYAYLEARGAYSKLAGKQDEVMFELRKQGIVPEQGISLILEDPRTTPYDKLLARTGFQIASSATPVPPLALETIPAREVVVAQVRAHPLFAYGKAYSALLDYTRQHGMALRMPTLERYSNSILTVEMPLEKSP
jgi:hypothetical protein